MQHKPATKLWLPGQGVVDLEPMSVHRALQKYDERLVFGRNEDTGDWCAFVKMGPGRAPVPVISFGRTIPEPEEAVRRCHRANTKAFGTELLNSVTKDSIEAQERRNQAENDKLSDAYAEIMEYAYRKAGAHPVPRIFLPRGV